ncbi:hypothetical protein DM01DRAFT_1335860, partial [Hesseltinella vesiculosa]
MTAKVLSIITAHHLQPAPSFKFEVKRTVQSLVRFATFPPAHCIRRCAEAEYGNPIFFF